MTAALFLPLAFLPLAPAAAAAQAATTPAPPFTQCPAVGQDASCQLLLVVNADNTITVLGDPALGPYDGSDDTLVGMVNNSKAAVPAITVTGPGSGLAGLDGDGLCTYSVSGCPFGPTGYEGPGTSIKTDPTLPDSAEIDFAGAGLAPGAKAYFSLEGALTAASITSRLGTLSTCAAVLYVGARGSGESGPGSQKWTQGSDPNDPYGFGPEVSNVYTRLVADLGKNTIQPDSVSYPAADVTVLIQPQGRSQYFAGLSVGVDQTMKDLTNYAATCKGQEIVLAGYSQGAMVMHRVLHLLAGSTAGQQIMSRVAAAVLIGDGDQVPFDNEVMDGSAWPFAEGIGQVAPHLSGSSPTRFSSSLGPRVLRVCNLGDIVCDFVNNALFGLARSVPGGIAGGLANAADGVSVHLHYPNSKPLLQAADQAAHHAQTLHYYGGKLHIKGKVGTPVSASAVVIGGKAPLTVSAGSHGTVPTWIALGTTGTSTVTLHGTPPAAGSWAFDIEVRDAGNHVVTIPVSLTVTT